MIVLTVITDEHDDGYLKFLKPSCEKNSLNLVVLIGREDSHTSHRRKDELLLKYLSQCTDSELCFFSDGYDTIFMGDEYEIVEKFKLFKRDIVFSAETVCWPDRYFESSYPNCTSPYRYLNSGGFIGYKSRIINFLEEGLDSNRFPWSNQYFWTIKYLSNRDLIGLDTDCKIFNTFSPEAGVQYIKDGKPSEQFELITELWFNKNFRIENDRVLNIRTHTFPSHLHFNGASKCLMKINSLKWNFYSDKKTFGSVKVIRY